MTRKQFYIEKYKNLVKYRISRPVSGHRRCHQHHIVPRCLNKKDKRTVSLTVFEHALAHWYLMMAYAAAKNTDMKIKMETSFYALLGGKYDELFKKLKRDKEIEINTFFNTKNEGKHI